MSDPLTEQVSHYIDSVMKAVGSMRQGDVLSLAMELAVHLAMDDLRQQVYLTPTTLTERRLDSPAVKALAKSLNRAGIDTPGMGSEEEDESVHDFLEEMGLLSDDEPVPYTTVFMDDDEDLHFPMQDD